MARRDRRRGTIPQAAGNGRGMESRERAIRVFSRKAKAAGDTPPPQFGGAVDGRCEERAKGRRGRGPPRRRRGAHEVRPPATLQEQGNKLALRSWVCWEGMRIGG